jgi:(E)-4-hydroxy-3-methylbut-2-enyl-diphosphate synthase
MVRLVGKIQRALRSVRKPIKVAVMGCVVNGPGEAREADVGLAAGRGVGLIFRKGKIVRKARERDFVKVLIEEINK